MSGRTTDAGPLAGSDSKKPGAAAGKPKPKGNSARRTPTQDRSQASLERMLQAALSLMSERASEDFTLLEVSQSGKVSIGSIYHQFRSKDDLVRAVIARQLADLAEIQQAGLQEVLRVSKTLEQFI